MMSELSANVDDDNSDVYNTSSIELTAAMSMDAKVKETSAEEDLLGAESLLMSDSDNEKEHDRDDNNKRASPPKSPRNDENATTTHVPQRRAKRILDSDEDEESTRDDATATAEIRAPKISALIDTDSEREEEEKEEEQPQRAKISALVDTDTDTESDGEGSKRLSKETHAKPSKKTLKKRSKHNHGTDTDSESERGAHSERDEHSGSDRSRADDTKKHTTTKPMRASAKKAMDDMQAIQSEQQRLHREAHISVPYHKPKKHTLQEFLKRRTIVKPQLGDARSPAPVTRNMKMTAEELEEYARLMEERAKEATEFFKSESEDDDQAARPPEETHTPEFQPSGSVEQSKVLSGDEASSSKAVIMEVLELPNIDLASMHLTPSDDQRHTPRVAANVKRLIGEGHWNESPTLRGDPNMLIDLDTGDLVAKQPTGVQNLMERLLLTNKHKKPKLTETVDILSTENGKIEMSKVSVHVAEETDPHKEQKPGAAYVKLKENLKSLITKKRMADMQRKRAEEEQEQHDDGPAEEEYEPDRKPRKTPQDDIVIDEDEEIVQHDEFEESEREEVAEVAGANEDDNDDDDDEEDEDEEEEEDDADDEVEDASAETGKRKHRIIKAFQDDSDDDGAAMPPPVGPISVPSLYEREDTLETAADAENELMALCSGQFEATQQSAVAGQSLISQMPMTQLADREQVADELLDLCSGKFEDDIRAPAESTQSNRILSSDDEEQTRSAAPAVAADENVRKKQLTKRMRKGKPKLGFSDDEDEQEEDEQEEDDEDDVDDAEPLPEEADEAPPDTFIDYDSDENEIVVQMTKTERVMKAQNFVENEAELSESDWGSADEDEQNLDRYDIELGDEDEFDREKLRSELGQIHARKMLDEDIREVKKLQELLFEDEEQDGVGRQRQFKWKNAELGFSLDDSALNRDADGGVDADDDDNENEHVWRKLRYEREQTLIAKGLKADAADTAVPPTTAEPLVGRSDGTHTQSPCAPAIRKVHIVGGTRGAAHNRAACGNSETPFLISKCNTLPHKKSVRGSFLVRDKETLHKLAGLTKGAASDAMDGTAGTVSAKAIKSKNFVFTSLTEEEHENQKRKADDLLNGSSNENGINYMKKPRMEARRDKCLIDQLL